MRTHAQSVEFGRRGGLASAAKATPEQQQARSSAGGKAAALTITPEQRRINGSKGGKIGAATRKAKLTE